MKYVLPLLALLPVAPVPEFTCHFYGQADLRLRSVRRAIDPALIIGSSSFRSPVISLNEHIVAVHAAYQSKMDSSFGSAIG